MRRLAITVLATLAIVALSPLRSLAQTEGAAPASQELFDTLAARDATLFAAVFDRCDADEVRTMVTDDLEFFHDKGGLTSTTGDSFAEGLRGHCARVQTGEDYAGRRELIPGTLKVYVLNNYGAVQMGEHRFYKLAPGKPEELVEVGKFIDVWKYDNGMWKLARVISYDHHLVN
jgi:hypothetical protein